MTTSRRANPAPAAAAALATALLLAAGAPAQVVLNEVVLDPTPVGLAGGSWQYVELMGAPGTDLTGLAVVVIAGGLDRDASGLPESPAEIDEAFSLDGYTIPTSGLFTLFNDADPAHPSQIPPLLTPNPLFQVSLPESSTNRRYLDGAAFSLTHIKAPPGAPARDPRLPPDNAGDFRLMQATTVLLVRNRPLYTRGAAQRYAPGYAWHKSTPVDVNADGALDTGGEPSIAGPSTDPRIAGVHRYDKVRSFFDAAKDRRADLVLIGDSNTRHSLIYGHEYGFTMAWSERFGAYATRVDPVAGLGGWGTGITGLRTSISGGDGFLITGAPEPLANLAFPVNAGVPEGYAYVPPGASVPSTATFRNISLQAYHPINEDSELRWHMAYGTFADSAGFPEGEINPTMRAITTGTVNYASTDPDGITTVTGTLGMTDLAFDVPAGPRDGAGVEFALWRLFGDDLRGPFFGLWSRIEDRQRREGVSLTTLLYQGGLSARNASISLNQQVTQAQMTEWFRNVTQLQGPTKAEHTVLVQIMHGGNDRSDIEPSVGPITEFPPISDTRDGHRNNVLGIMGALRTFWAGAGYDPDRLFFQLGPYHPQTGVVNALRNFEEAWIGIADEEPNTCAVLGSRISSPEEFEQRRWYITVQDRAHLSASGFRNWPLRTMDVLSRASLPSAGAALGPVQILDEIAFTAGGGRSFASSAESTFTEAAGDAPRFHGAMSRLAYWTSNPGRGHRLAQGGVLSPATTADESWVVGSLGFDPDVPLGYSMTVTAVGRRDTTGPTDPSAEPYDDELQHDPSGPYRLDPINLTGFRLTPARRNDVASSLLGGINIAQFRFVRGDFNFDRKVDAEDAYLIRQTIGASLDDADETGAWRWNGPRAQTLMAMTQMAAGDGPAHVVSEADADAAAALVRAGEAADTTDGR